MESKRKIVNGETVCECEFSVNELGVVYGALVRLWNDIDEKIVEAGDSPSEEFYDEYCQKVDRLVDKIRNIMR